MLNTPFQTQKIFKKNYYFPFRIYHQSEAPCCAGVYFLTTVVNVLEVPYYIGSSKNLRSRLYGHPIWRSMELESILASVYFIPMRESDYKSEEVFFIRNFQPEKNKTHKKIKPDEYTVSGGIKISQVSFDCFKII